MGMGKGIGMGWQGWDGIGALLGDSYDCFWTFRGFIIALRVLK